MSNNLLNFLTLTCVKETNKLTALLLRNCSSETVAITIGIYRTVENDDHTCKNRYKKPSKNLPFRQEHENG